MRRWLSFLFLLVTVSTAFSQVRVSLECDRSNYMLYAPVVARAIITNNTEQDVIFQNTPDATWLTFVVRRTDGFPVRSDQKFNPEPLALKAGESKSVAVNLTPYYAFREPGNYKAQASIELPGIGQITSGNLQFNVIRGQSVWHKTRPVDGSERTYTLLRFSPDNMSTELYLRVDDTKENLVYSTVSLGPIIAVVEPQTYFDREGQLHVLHTSAQGSYRYTRFDINGNLENQSSYEAEPEAPPRLTQTSDGSVIVVGGQINNENNQREKLSEGKFGLTAAATPPAKPNAAAGKTK